MAMSRFEGCRSLTTWPPMRISPEEIDSRPAIVFRSVDLPQPEGPTSTRKPPFSREMSMPFRISRAPYFLRRDWISSVDIGLSFHSAGHQAANEITSGKNVDEQGRSSGDDRGGHIDVVFNDAGRGVDDIVERDRNRRGVARGESRAEQEIVPDVGELVDHRDDEDGRRVRQNDSAEDLEEARAIHLRGADQFIRERLVIVAEKERREAKPIDQVDQHEVDGRIAEAERPADQAFKGLSDRSEPSEDRRHRNEDGLEGNE